VICSSVWTLICDRLYSRHRVDANLKWTIDWDVYVGGSLLGKHTSPWQIRLPKNNYHTKLHSSLGLLSVELLYRLSSGVSTLNPQKHIETTVQDMVEISALLDSVVRCSVFLSVWPCNRSLHAHKTRSRLSPTVFSCIRDESGDVITFKHKLADSMWHMNFKTNST